MGKIYVYYHTYKSSMTPKAKATKANIKWEDITLKASARKKTINRMKRQPTKRGKAAANHASDNGLISKVHIKNS